MALHLNFGSRQKVFIVHVGPDNVFSMQQDTEEAYGLTDLSERIEQEVAAGKHQKANPEVGRRCLAQSEADGVWYRALVTSYSGSLVTAYYVDYGNTEQLQASSVYAPSECLFSMPYQAIQCVLSDFIAGGSNAELGDAQQELILNKELHAVVQSECSSRAVLASIPLYNVTLFDSQDSGVSLSQQLVEKKLGQYRICNNNVQIGKTYSAYTSFDDSPGKFWIQLSDDFQKLEELMDSLNSKETVSSLQILPVASMNAGVACTCLFEDGRYYRAEIVRDVRSEKKASICFVDYGNCASVSVSDVKQLPPHLVVTPLFAVQCCLEGIKPIKPARPDPKLGNIAWTKQACQKFNQLTQDVEMEACVVSEISPEIFSVQLQDVSTGEDIGRVLCTSNFAEVSVPKVGGMSPQKAKVSEPQEYQYLNLETKGTYNNLFISYADSPAIVWCQPAMETVKFEALCAELAEESPRLAPLGDVVVDSPCCMQYEADESWCRGCIQSVDGSTATAQVLFVDFGNVESVHFQEIKALPSKYLSFPAQAVSFSVAEITPRTGKDWSKAAMECFQELVVERSLYCRIAGLDNDGYPAAELVDPLTNTNVALEMVNRGYAKMPLTGAGSTMQNHLKSPDTRLPRQNTTKHSQSGSVYSSNMSSPARTQRGRPEEVQKASPSPSTSSRHSSRSRESPQSSFNSKSLEKASPSHGNLKYSMTQLQPGKAVMATVYHIESLTEFYIQLSSSSAKLEQMMDKVNVHCKSPEASALRSPRPGLPALALYSGDGSWYRAIIVSPLNKGACMIVFVDFGNTEKVTLTNLVHMPSQFLELPMQAVQCSLNGIHTDKPFPDSIINAFGLLAIEQEFRVLVKDATRKDGQEVYAVDLTTSGGDSVLKELVRQGSLPESLLQHSSPSPSPATARTKASVQVPLPQLPLNQPLGVAVSYSETPTKFYVQLTDNYQALEQLLNSLDQCYSQLSASQELLGGAQVGIFCAAKFSEDQLWYRGRVTKVTGSTVTVTYIDFGNSEDQNLSALKTLKSEFCKVPCIAIPCHLSGVGISEGFSEEVLERFFKCHEKKLVGVFEGQFSSYEDTVAVKLTDTSNTGVDLDILDIVCPRTEAPGGMHLPEVTPVFGSPMESVVSYISSPDELYCQLASEQDVFDALMNKMYEYYGENHEGSPVPSPCVGSYCVALYSDGSWYRGQVRSISPKAVTVFYLDYGNTEEVDSTSLRSLELEFCSVPVHGMKCHLRNVRPPKSGWSEKTITMLQRLLLEKNVQAIYSKSGGSGRGYPVQLIVEGEDVAEVLARECLTDSATAASCCVPPYPVGKGLEHSGIVTCALSPMEVYIQILGDEEKLEALMQDIADYCLTTHPNQSTKWKPGEHVLAQFTQDDGWYRASIISADKDRFKVFYLDYGNSELLDKHRFRETKQEFCHLPAQAVKCRIEGAQYYKYTSQSTQQFNDLLLDQSFLVKYVSISEDGTCAVDLISAEDSVDVMSLAIQNNIVQAKISSVVSQDTANKLCTQTFPSGTVCDSFHDVIVVYAESPSNFFCQFNLNNESLGSQMEELEQFYASSPKTAGDFKIGDFVAAQFSEDNSWYRAVISETGSSSVNVVFVDYGNSETILYSQVRKLDPKFTSLPAQAVPCCLAEVVPAGNVQWSPEANREFSEHTVEHSCVAQIKNTQDMSGRLFKFGDNQQLEVTLIDSETSKSAAEELVQLKLAVFTTPSVTSESSVTSVRHRVVSSEPASTPFTSLSLQVGETYDVYTSSVESPSRFWLQLASSEEALATIQEKVKSSSASSSQLLNPLPGTTCCSKFSGDECWYRSVVKAKRSTGVDVLFVDYGNSEVVQLSDVRVVKPELLAWEAQAFCCTLHGCKSVEVEEDGWSENAVDMFNLMTEEKPLKACIVSSVDESSWSVRLIDGDNDVCDQLVQCEVAVKESPSPGKRAPTISKVELSVGQDYSMYIAYIDSPSNFFCQLSSEYDRLDSLMAEIADFYNAHTLEPLLEEGAYCVAQYSHNFAWYRGRIISILPEGALVNFIDYGNSEIVATHQILALEAQFAKLPSQAVSCSIVEDENYLFPEEVLEKFIEYDLDQVFTVSVSSLSASGRHVVKLFDQEGSLVNESLFSAEPVKPPAALKSSMPPVVSISPAIKSYVPLHYELGSSVDVFVSHIVSPSSFFCQPFMFTGELEDMMTDICSYMTSESYQPLPPESMQWGMVCLSQYTGDNDWYRAVIEEVISDTNALVNFVDYGNREVTSLDRLSVLPSQFAKLPLQALHCRLGSDTAWNVDQVATFRSLVPETEQFTVRIEDFVQSNNQYVVKLFKNGVELDLAVLTGEKSEMLSEALLEPPRDLGANQALLQMHVDNTSMLAVKGSKTPSRDSGSDNGETETTDDGSEGKPLIQAPFKLSLAVQEVLEVSVVSVESPSLIFIQRADCKVELQSLSEEIAQYCASIGEGSQFPLVFCEGDYVLAKWSEDDLWYRGEVIGVDSSSSEGVSKVSFIDYGNVEVMSSQRLVMCPKNFLDLPAQAISCSLAQVPHRDSWPMMYKDLVLELVEGKELQASVVLPGSQGMKATVRLEDPEEQLDIAQAVLEKLQEECDGGSSEVIAEEDEEEAEEEEKVPRDTEEEEEVPRVTEEERAVQVVPGNVPIKEEALISKCSPISLSDGLATSPPPVSTSHHLNHSVEKVDSAVYPTIVTSPPDCSPSVTSTDDLVATPAPCTEAPPTDPPAPTTSAIPPSNESLQVSDLQDPSTDGLTALQDPSTDALTVLTDDVATPANDPATSPATTAAPPLTDDPATSLATKAVHPSTDDSTDDPAISPATAAAPDPATSTDDPATSIDDPATHTDDPPTSTDATSTDDPPTSIDDPPTSIDDPPTSIDDPPTSIDDPPTSIDDPPTSIDDPPTSIGDPPTSIDDPPTSPVAAPLPTDDPATSPAADNPATSPPAPPPVDDPATSTAAPPPGDDAATSPLAPPPVNDPATSTAAPPLVDDPATSPPAPPPVDDPATPTAAPPPTKGQAEFATQYMPTPVPVGSHFTVVVSVSDESTPEAFVCRLLDHQIQLEELMEAMAARSYEVGEDALSCVSPGTPVCACGTLDNTWRRGKVVSAGKESSTYSVLYVDDGSKEDLPVQRIRHLEKCFAECLPPQSISCSLPVLLESDVNPDLPSSWEAWELKWPVSCDSLFVDLTSNKQRFSLEVLALREDGTCVVRLFCDECDVREVLVAKLRDPKEHVIREPVVGGESLAGERTGVLLEEGDEERTGPSAVLLEGGEGEASDPSAVLLERGDERMDSSPEGGEGNPSIVLIEESEGEGTLSAVLLEGSEGVSVAQTVEVDGVLPSEGADESQTLPSREGEWMVALEGSSASEGGSQTLPTEPLRAQELVSMDSGSSVIQTYLVPHNLNTKVMRCALNGIPFPLHCCAAMFTYPSEYLLLLTRRGLDSRGCSAVLRASCIGVVQREVWIRKEAQHSLKGVGGGGGGAEVEGRGLWSEGGREGYVQPF